jgi:hypothetical protein
MPVGGAKQRQGHWSPNNYACVVSVSLLRSLFATHKQRTQRDSDEIVGVARRHQQQR